MHIRRWCTAGGDAPFWCADPADKPILLMRQSCWCADPADALILLMRRSCWCADFNNVWRCSTIFFTIFNFDDFCQLWQSLLTWQWHQQRQKQKQSRGLVTFGTLITILTIENLNTWQSLLPYNKEWHWTAFAILAMFIIWLGPNW